MRLIYTPLRRATRNTTPTETPCIGQWSGTRRIMTIGDKWAARKDMRLIYTPLRRATRNTTPTETPCIGQWLSNLTMQVAHIDVRKYMQHHECRIYM